MARPWFRFYRSVLHSAKLQRLKPDLFKAWANMLCASDDEGRLPPTDDLAFALRTSPEKIAEWLTILTRAGLFETLPDGGFVAHDWSEHQRDSDVSNTRVQRYRARHRNGECNVTCNGSVSAQSREDTDTDTDKNKTPPLPPEGVGEGDSEVARTKNQFPTPADLREATTHWNTLAAELGLPQVERLTDKRQKHLRARLQELEGLGPWFGVVNSIRDSPFLRGQKTDWRCDFDWFVNASNFQKVIEGKYAERGKSNASH